MKNLFTGLVAAGALLLQSGCATTDSERATALGAGLGAGLGMILGHNFGHSESDRLLGAAAGAMIGGAMARQQVEQQQLDTRLRATHQQQMMTTVWIVNSNGSRTPVLLRAVDGGAYIGPRGEYYAGVPTEDQLRPIYGF